MYGKYYLYMYVYLYAGIPLLHCHLGYFVKKNPKLMCQIVRLYIPGQLSMETNTRQLVLHF